MLQPRGHPRPNCLGPYNLYSASLPKRFICIEQVGWVGDRGQVGWKTLVTGLDWSATKAADWSLPGLCPLLVSLDLFIAKPFDSYCPNIYIHVMHQTAHRQHSNSARAELPRALFRDSTRFERRTATGPRRSRLLLRALRYGVRSDASVLQRAM